jgi:hypothetical protein
LWSGSALPCLTLMAVMCLGWNRFDWRGAAGGVPSCIGRVCTGCGDPRRTAFQPTVHPGTHIIKIIHSPSCIHVYRRMTGRGIRRPPHTLSCAHKGSDHSVLPLLAGFSSSHNLACLCVCVCVVQLVSSLRQNQSKGLWALVAAWVRQLIPTCPRTIINSRNTRDTFAQTPRTVVYSQTWFTLHSSRSTLVSHCPPNLYDIDGCASG